MTDRGGVDAAAAEAHEGLDAAATAEAHMGSIEDLAAALGVDAGRGLSVQEARSRAAAVGPNVLEPPRRESVLAMLVEAASEPFIVVLAVSGILVQAAIPFIPGVAEAFRGSGLDLEEWLLVAVVALLPAVVAELIRARGRTLWVA